MAAYVGGLQPLHFVRQYGLEQAFFNGQLAVARYLLENGIKIHGNVCERCGRENKPINGYKSFHTTTIFSHKEKDYLADLLRTFLDAGWHPN